MKLAKPPLAAFALLIRREWRRRPGRQAVAVLAVATGVALASSVHWINGSALAEFDAAERAASGAPDLTLRATAGTVDDHWFERIAADPQVAQASPLLEVDAQARSAAGKPIAVRVIGIDALRALPLAPALRPLPAADAAPLAALDPTRIFVNAAARLALDAPDGATVELRSGPAWQRFVVAGTVALPGAPAAVVDIAGAQLAFGAIGRLSRIDVRLAAGAGRERVVRGWALPAGLDAREPASGAAQRSNVSRAYRVNLAVLAFVALFVGAFLVYSVVALAVAERTPAFALLGVLGLAARGRRALVTIECLLVGAAGSAVGLALGTVFAWAALRWLAGDLGGGYFRGIAPSLQVAPASALGFGALGVAVAVAGGLLPARAAERLAPAQALKGLGGRADRPARPVAGIALVALGGALALAPPVAGLPLAAYGAVAALIAGGVALVPAAVDALLARVPTPRSALALLALRRARHERRSATAAVAGVVASLALSVALVVMVQSFRNGVSDWLDIVLPADLYARLSGSSAAAQSALPPAIEPAVAGLPGVRRVAAARVRPLALAADWPPVTLIARRIDASTPLPLVGHVVPAPPGRTGVWVSEAVAALYRVAPGDTLVLPLGREGTASVPDAAPAAPAAVTVHVAGVWRDYARQFGAIAIDANDYRRLTGDSRVDDLAIWLADRADAPAVEAAVRSLLPDPQALEFASSGELRALSLRIFDRSFAVTRYLQAVAITVGLVGVAASLSAQVLARRKEFGLLAHLGFTRREVQALVTAETAVWVGAGAVIGVALGVAVAVVLVEVVNPQSFHWSMALVLPAGRLLALTAAVWAAGVATAAWSAHGALGMPAVRAVREDW